MIETRARVVGIDGADALVETSAAGGCSACGAHAGCGASRLGRLVSGRPRVWRVANALQARPGDEVMLGLPEEAMLAAAVAGYGPPLLGALAGALTAFALAGGDVWPALGGGVGLVAGLAVARGLADLRPAHHVPRMIARAGGQHPVRFHSMSLREGEQP